MQVKHHGNPIIPVILVLTLNGKRKKAFGTGKKILLPTAARKPLVGANHYSPQN
jgi:hypothetical protein